MACSGNVQGSGSVRAEARRIPGSEGTGAGRDAPGDRPRQGREDNRPKDQEQQYGNQQIDQPGSDQAEVALHSHVVPGMRVAAPAEGVRFIAAHMAAQHMRMGFSLFLGMLFLGMHSMAAMRSGMGRQREGRRSGGVIQRSAHQRRNDHQANGKPGTSQKTVVEAEAFHRHSLTARPEKERRAQSRKRSFAGLQ